MKLHSMGIAYRHESDFEINRPHGSGDWLLLIFKTPAFVWQRESRGETRGESRVETPRDTALLYSENAPQHYGAAGVEYINHWVHFECAEDDVFFEKTRAALCEPVPLRSCAAAESVLSLLSLESVSGGECEDLLLRLLIAKTVGAQGGAAKSPHSERLRSLRAQLYANPAGRFTVSGMARSASLSPSYFQALYKAEFGVSCYEDVISAKMELARYYLANTALSVSETAELCGYDNEEHFMRQFRQRMGMTAGEFRKKG